MNTQSCRKLLLITFLLTVAIIMPLGSPAGPLSVQAEAALSKRPLLNTRRVADRNLGPMLPATRYLLREFHQPLNQKLASVLDSKAFLWDNT